MAFRVWTVSGNNMFQYLPHVADLFTTNCNSSNAIHEYKCIYAKFNLWYKQYKDNIHLKRGYERGKSYSESTTTVLFSHSVSTSIHSLLSDNGRTRKPRHFQKLLLLVAVPKQMLNCPEVLFLYALCFFSKLLTNCTNTNNQHGWDQINNQSTHDHYVFTK